MKIIGRYKKGNVVRFALADESLDYWSGDDWNDAPYEHNADTFPLFGIEAIVDVAFSYDVSVLEACDDYHYKGNSPFSMDDFKERKAPILLIDPTGKEECYSEASKNPDVIAIYMGDSFDTDNFEEANYRIFNMESY